MEHTQQPTSMSEVHVNTPREARRSHILTSGLFIRDCIMGLSMMLRITSGFCIICACIAAIFGTPPAAVGAAAAAAPLGFMRAAQGLAAAGAAAAAAAAGAGADAAAGAAAAGVVRRAAPLTKCKV